MHVCSTLKRPAISSACHYAGKKGQTRRIRRPVFGLLIALLLVSLAQQAVQARTLVLAHSGWDGSIMDLSARDFAKRVEQISNGTLRIKIFGQGKLGQERDLVEIVRYGKVDLVLVAFALKNVIPEFAKFDIPFLVRDRSQLLPLSDKFVWPVLDPIAKTYAYKIVGFWEFGFRHITSSRHPIRKPSDLKGMKMRTSGNEWSNRTFRYWGASPTTIPFQEVFPALERGFIDGQEAYISILGHFKFPSSQRFLSLTAHSYTPAFLITGQELWLRLDSRSKKFLKAAARETQDFSYRVGSELDARTLETLKIEIIEAHELEREAFNTKSKGVYDEFAKKVRNGAQLLTDALRATKKKN